MPHYTDTLLYSRRPSNANTKASTVPLKLKTFSGIRSKRLSISEKYDAMTWNKENADSLGEMFQVSPLNVHCLGHDGELLEVGSLHFTSVVHREISKYDSE